MMMVIFGAGASYDSVPSRQPSTYNRALLPTRPPLADELFLPDGLFAESLASFPKIRPIVPYLQSHEPGITIEHRLEVLQAEGDTDEERKRQIAAVRFYLHDMITVCEQRWDAVAHGVTNYVTLLDQLRRTRSSEPVLLVTFNYDTLIEKALESVGISITKISDYIHYEAFKLFKLHGSIQWAREVTKPAITNVSDRNVWDIVNELIENAGTLKLSDSYRLMSGRPIGKIDNTPLFPALAIPVETKRVFECPSEHLDCLRAHLPKVTRILIVGWRATERHFLALLKDHLATEVDIQPVVNNEEEAREILSRIGAAGIGAKGMPTPLGFTEYVVTRNAERFFKM
jgi:hypothetical protein